MAEEGNQKQRLRETIETGLTAAVKLYILKRVPFARIEEYAEVLEERYSVCAVWTKVTHSLVKASVDVAREVFKTKLKGTSQTESLIDKIYSTAVRTGKT